MTPTKFRWRTVAEDPLTIKTHSQTLTALSADARRKLFLPASSSHLRNTPLHLKIHSDEWQHPSSASFQRRDARMGCNPHAAALPNLSNRHSASPARPARSRQRIFVTVPKANPIILVTIPSAIPIPRAPRVGTSPRVPPAPTRGERSSHSQTPLPKARVTGVPARFAPSPRFLRVATAAAASHPRGRPLRAPRCGDCALLTSLKVPAGFPNLRRGDPGSPKPGGDLLPPPSPCSREARPQLAPSAHPRCTRRLLPCGRGRRRKKKRQGGREQPRATPRPRCATH